MSKDKRNPSGHYARGDHSAAREHSQQAYEHFSRASQASEETSKNN
jgi:hypothetical protein